MKLSIAILLALAGIAWYVNDGLGAKFAAISPIWLALILFAALPHFLIEPMRWQIYLGSDKRYKPTLLYRIFFCTAFLTYLLPAKLGLPIRYWLLTRHLHLAGSATAVYMAMDSTLNILIWTAASLLLGGGLVYSAIIQHLPSSGQFIGTGIGATLAVLVMYRLGHKWIDILWARLRTALAEIKLYWLTLVSGLFLFEIAGFVLLHAAILAALSAPFIGWQALATATVLSMYAGYLTMLPMGLVGYDASIVILLSQYGIGMESAILVPLIYRAAILLISVALGLPSTLKLGLKLDVKAIAAKVAEKRGR